MDKKLERFDRYLIHACVVAQILLVLHLQIKLSWKELAIMII